MTYQVVDSWEYHRVVFGPISNFTCAVEVRDGRNQRHDHRNGVPRFLIEMIPA